MAATLRPPIIGPQPLRASLAAENQFGVVRQFGDAFVSEIFDKSLKEAVLSNAAVTYCPLKLRPTLGNDIAWALASECGTICKIAGFPAMHRRHNPQCPLPQFARSPQGQWPRERSSFAGPREGDSRFDVYLSTMHLSCRFGSTRSRILLPAMKLPRSISPARTPRRSFRAPSRSYEMSTSG